MGIFCCCRIGDLLFRNHFYLNVCVVDVDLDGGYLILGTKIKWSFIDLAEAREVYARKMAEYTVIANSNAQMLHMIKALQSISGIIKQTLKFISESSKCIINGFLRIILHYIHRCLSMALLRPLLSIRTCWSREFHLNSCSK